jgi:hypothetical protein
MKHFRNQNFPTRSAVNPASQSYNSNRWYIGDKVDRERALQNAFAKREMKREAEQAPPKG